MIVNEVPVDKENFDFQRLNDQIFAVVEHPKIDFISYPYEWPFALLKGAALHHLKLHRTLLDEGLTLSDATAYNIQFNGVNPIHIDTLSIRPYIEGELWGGYRQFCDQFLNPLMLYAKGGLFYNDIFRGYFEGVPSSLLTKSVSFFKKISPSYFIHIALPNLLKEAHTLEQKTLNSHKSGLKIVAYKRLLEHLAECIKSLKPPPSERTTWGDYEKSHSYNTSEEQEKIDFISQIVSQKSPQVVWDLGCNAGKYSVLALNSGAKSVVGFDLDHKALDICAQRASANELRFLPLVMDMTNPSPQLGWMNKERKDLFQRRNADFLICLAFIHHLVIGKNIPLKQFASWLTELSPSGVVEFVTKEDPMVKKMLSLREDIFYDYTLENFRSIMETYVVIKEVKAIKETRHLFYYEPK